MNCDHYKQTSDRVWCEVSKTFRSVKKEKIPRFSFFCRLVKLHGEDEVVKILGSLRENKSFNKINDFTRYLQGLFKTLK